MLLTVVVITAIALYLGGIPACTLWFDELYADSTKDVPHWIAVNIFAIAWPLVLVIVLALSAIEEIMP